MSKGITEKHPLYYITRYFWENNRLLETISKHSIFDLTEDLNFSITK